MNYEIPNIELNDESQSVIDSLDETIKIINERRSKGLSQSFLQNLNRRLKIEHVFNSNAIEGNQLTLRETETILEGISINERPIKDEIEAKSLSNATDYLYDLIKGVEQPNKRTLLELHGLIIDKKIDTQSGVFRKNNVKITGSNHTAVDFLDIESHIEKMFMWINRNRHKYHPVVISTIMHHWLTWIHPFNDGNGRVSRLMLDFFLLHTGYLQVIIKLNERDKYYNALTKADKGDLSKLIEIIVDCSIVTAKQYIEAFNEEDRSKDFQRKLKNIGEEQYEKAKKQHSFKYEVWKNNMMNFKELVKQNVFILDEKMPTVECSIKEYEMISFNQYLDFMENKKVDKTWWFNFRLYNTINRKKITILFYFERFGRRIPLKMLGVEVKKDGKIMTRVVNPTIRLFITPRIDGKSEKFDKKINLRTVTADKDKLKLGLIKEYEKIYKKGKIAEKPIWTNTDFSPNSEIEKFILQVLETYLK